LPSDKEFRTNFELAEERGAAKARFLLTRLESQARKAAGKADLGPELEPRASLTVEHILPKSPGENWESVLARYPTFAEEYAHRVGNLSLLTQVNRRLGNAAFADKRETYAKSGLLITSDVAKVTKWTPREVEERQARLAKLAITAWRFD
jgi:hypothetical protein